MPRRDGLYKRGEFWWLRTDPVTGRRITTGCRDKGAAQRFQAERERIAADPAYAAANTATIARWIAETKRVKAESRATGTQHMYDVKLGHIARIFGADSKMASITPRTIDVYIQQRRTEGAANNTIQRELTCLVQMVKLARRAGEYAGDVSALRPVGFSAGYVPRKRWLTLAEVTRLRAVMPHQRYAWLAFSICTGARFSEVQRARLEDWNDETRTVLLRGTKTEGSHREVPIVDGLFLFLWRSALSQLEYGALVPWDRAAHELPMFCRLAGIPAATPNDLRRTHAQWLRQAGARNDLVAGMLGHKDSKLVDRVYGRLGASELGRLLTSQTGTSTSHIVTSGEETSDESSIETDTRPLGEKVNAKDLKGCVTGRDVNSLEQLSELERPGGRRGITGLGTSTSHSIAGLALGYAALSVGVMP